MLAEETSPPARVSPPQWQWGLRTPHARKKCRNYLHGNDAVFLIFTKPATLAVVTLRSGELFSIKLSAELTENSEKHAREPFFWHETNIKNICTNYD